MLDWRSSQLSYRICRVNDSAQAWTGDLQWTFHSGCMGAGLSAIWPSKHWNPNKQICAFLAIPPMRMMDSLDYSHICPGHRLKTDWRGVESSWAQGFSSACDYPCSFAPGLDGVGVGLDVLDPLCSPCTGVFDYRTCAPSYYSLAFILRTTWHRSLYKFFMQSF